MAFAGWPVEALEFYDGLEADNSKSYWLAHEAVFDACVLAPMRELTAELESELGPARIFRPYRDIRFSKDKSPYKTEIAATVGDGFVRLSAAGLAAGRGLHGLDPAQLDCYRRAVADDRSGRELDQILAELDKQEIGVSSSQMLRTVPRGYPADHPRASLLRCKGLYAWREWPVEPWLGTARARAEVAGVLSAAGPLGGWLAQHVGRQAR